MAARSSSKPVPAMCVVQIGFTTVLMPAANGIKVVQLLGDALDCDRRYDGDTRERYQITGPLRVEYRSVNPNQVTGLVRPDRKPLELPHE